MSPPSELVAFSDLVVRVTRVVGSRLFETIGAEQLVGLLLELVEQYTAAQAPLYATEVTESRPRAKSDGLGAHA